ncbi:MULTISPECIES: hypothetical protein [Streptomyces]|uniref:Uncharacterized protein n=1 Tax=Streptomyces mordarskii TaxID=1226758 RepID=A0ABP3NVC2_9ACTN
MSVMSPARTRATHINLSDVATAHRDKFLNLMDQADQTISVPEILLLHSDAADAIGLQLPPRGEIAVCSCGCNCLIVFDADAAHTFNDGYGETTQCPACADDHRGHTAE